MRERRTVRVLLLDGDGRILLMKGRLPSAPEAPGVWFTVGGGIESGETIEAAARREIAEETGFSVGRIGPILWLAEQVHHDRKGRPVRIAETFVSALCAGSEPSRAGWDSLEREFVDDIRWWTLTALEACDEPLYPPDLALRLADLLAAP